MSWFFAHFFNSYNSIDITKVSESELKHCFSVDSIPSSFPIHYAWMSHVDRNQLRKLLPLLLQFPIPTRELKKSKHHYHHLEFRHIFSTCKVNRHPVKLNNKAIHATKSTAPDLFFYWMLHSSLRNEVLTAAYCHLYVHNPQPAYKTGTHLRNTQRIQFHHCLSLKIYVGRYVAKNRNKFVVFCPTKHCRPVFIINYTHIPFSYHLRSIKTS